jgi:hypothetical protein
MAQNKKPTPSSALDPGDLGGGLKISLKQGALPPNAESPKVLGGGINPGRGAAPERPQNGEEKNQGAPNNKQKASNNAHELNQEVSKIKGLSKSSSLIPEYATEIGPAMIAPASSSRRIFKWFIILAILGGIGYVASNKPLRNKVVKTTISTKNKIMGTVRYQPKSNKKKNTSKMRYDKAEKVKPFVVADKPRTAGAPRTCQSLISGSVGGKVTVRDRTDLAECYLMVDDLGSAEQSLTAIKAELVSTPEAKLNSIVATRNISDAYIMLTTIYALQGRFRDAAELTRGKCQRWQVSNTCVARAVLAALRKDQIGSDPGVAAMFQTNGGLDRKAQARLWWAGGLIAEKSKNKQVIDQRFTLAMKSAPTDAVSIKKNIYESYAVNLYKRGEMIKLNAVISRAMADLKRMNKQSKVKLQTLQTLAVSGQKAAAVKSLLASEGVAFRARSDFELMEILGAASITGNQADGYLLLAKKSREFFLAKKYERHPYERNLSQWEIRMFLAKKEYELALGSLNSYGEKLDKDLFFYHMRGVAYHHMSTDPRFQVQAAGEFQNALRRERGWEPLYALGVTLLRGKKINEAATTLRDLERMIKTRGQKYWLEMLKAEYYLARKNYPSATEILTKWTEEESEYFTPRRLLIQMYQAQGLSSEALRVEGDIADIGRSKKYETSFEGMASPLGLMAVGERPID